MITNAKKPKLNVSKQPKLSVRIRQNTKIIIHDVGFLLGMQVWLNIRNLLMLPTILIDSGRKIICMIISIDAKKGFDKNVVSPLD